MKALTVAALAIVLAGCWSPVPSNHFQGMIGDVPFQLDTRKQTALEGLTFKTTHVTVTGSNIAELRIEKLTGANDPQVIDKSYAGQAAVAKTYLDGLKGFAESLTKGGAEGAVKGLTGKP